MANPLLSDPNSQEIFQNQDNSNPLLSDPNSRAIFGENKIIPDAVPVTQNYGNSNPGVEVFSHGINTGADLGTKVGTPVSLPAGRWQVLEAYDKAKNGYIGDNENSGYGNSVKVKNLATGETLRFSHLSKVSPIPGQILQGGQIGDTGATGNVTGPHLDLEYTNEKGQLEDVLKSSYGKYLPTIN